MMNVIPQTQAYVCPCCQGFIGEAAPIEMVLERVPRGQQKAILEVLARRIGRTVAKSSLISALFDDRADGGPDSASQQISVQIAYLRKNLKQFGWSIVSNGGGRSVEGMYRLIPTEVGQ